MLIIQWDRSDVAAVSLTVDKHKWFMCL
jgi:hypothetical protein